MAELYVLDPDGDLIVTHRALRGPFAPWNRSEGPSDIRDGEPDLPPELRFKVSSKHLTLGSPRFKKMLAGPYKEANLPCPEVTIEEFDSSIRGQESTSPKIMRTLELRRV